MILFFIFGTRGVTTTGQQGQFHCPECGEKRPYAVKRVRRFFTLYFIPLIPLGLLGEYVECGSCKGSFKPDVIHYNPEQAAEKFHAEFHKVIRRIMVLMMLADGEVEAAEIKLIGELYPKITDKPLSEAEIRAEIAAARQDPLTAEDYLKKVTGGLNDRGKELVIKAAYLVAAADGQFQQPERELIETIARTLEISPAHLKGILAEMCNGSE